MPGGYVFNYQCQYRKLSCELSKQLPTCEKESVTALWISANTVYDKFTIKTCGKGLNPFIPTITLFTSFTR